METDFELYIQVRNLIQMKYQFFRGSTVHEVTQLKELSIYPLKLIGHELEKCVVNHIPENTILSELLKKMKSLIKSTPKQTEINEFYDKHQGNSNHRCLVLLDSGLSSDEMRPIIYNVLDIMRDDNILRNDRPVPTDPKFQWQVPLIKGMNDSDTDYMTDIDTYKNDNGIKLIDRIPMDKKQQEWFDYIQYVSDTHPESIKREETGLTLITNNKVIDPLDLIEF